MSTPVTPPTPPTPEEIAQAVENVENTASWLVRIVRAIKAAFRRPPSPPAVAAVLALALPMLSCSPATMAGVATAVATTGTIIKIVGSVHVPPPPADGQPAARPTPTPVPVAPYTPIPLIPTSTPTPTTAPTAVPIPTTVPTMPPAPEVTCVDVSRIPAAPVPALHLLPGPCLPGMRRLDIEGTGQHACVADWRCVNDLDDTHNCWSQAQKNVNEFHEWGMGPDGFFSAGEHYRKDAYCRPIDGNGNIHQPGPEPDGYQPGAWEYEAICRPATCVATPAPTSAPPAPTAAPTFAPPTTGVGCNLPRGDGPGLDCPRTSPRILAAVTDAVDAVVTLYPDMLEPGAEVVRVGFENAFRQAVVDQLRGGGLCAFFDGEEVAVKNTNAFSEQYAVLSSDRRVRRGENTYRATCTPAWSAIPATTEAAPTPAPTAPPAAAPPLLVLVRVGDRCSNPADGNRYLQRHECIVDSTNWYRDPHTPDDVKRDGPCDQDHALAWATFCHEQSQDDPRGIEINVTGANWVRDETNPQRAVVTFTPGQEFMVCVHPFADAHNAQGQPIPVLGTAEQCKSQTH